MIALLASAVISVSVRVDGAGYLRFVRDGRIVYATSADLSVQGGVLGCKGLALTPSIRVAGRMVSVDPSGNVTVGKSPCGRLMLAQFDAPLTDAKGWLVAAGRATVGYPGENGFGYIRTADSSAGVPPVTSATIAVNGVTEVETATVTLGQIAQINGDAKTKQTLEAIIYSNAPSIGIDMPVTASRIQALMKRAGVDATVTVPHGAVIRHQSQSIKQDDFIAAAIKAGQAQLGAELPMKSSDTQGDFKAPAGPVELKAEGITTSGTTMAVTVAVYVDGKRVNSRTVNLKIDAAAEIKAGTAVKILMKSGGLTVEVPGKTRTGGVIGQTITVVTDTGSVLTGTVVGTDRVEVKI